MRVVHVSTPMVWRGGEQQILNLALSLDEMGVEQLVVCPIGSAIEARCAEEGVPFQSVRQRGFLGVRLAWSIKRVVEAFGADIVHLHDAHAHSAGIVASDFWGMTCPMVLSRRVDFPIKNSKLSHYKYNHRHIRRIVCVSNAIADIVAQSVRTCDKIVVVHDGINVERFKAAKNSGKLHQEYAIGADVRIVGNISALADHKDHDTFLRTAGAVGKQRQDVVFFIIGEGDQRSAIERRIQELGLEKYVFLTGFRNDIPEILPEFDVFLFTSKTEGLGSSLFDAMACGVPIVATRAGGIPEIVHDNVNGLLAEVGDDKSLADKVIHVLSDDALGNTLRRSGRKQLTRFSSSLTARNTLEQYRSVLRE